MPKSESLTKLLKSKKAGISAVKANQILLDLQILIEKERQSSKDPSVIKKFKALTDKGLEFGENRENFNNPEETSPYYYVDKFDHLLELLLKNQ